MRGRRSWGEGAWGRVAEEGGDSLKFIESTEQF
jgi:hypothetical protein